jgi:hypothetical protein
VKNKNYSPIYAIFFPLLLTVDTSSLSNIATRVAVSAAFASGAIHLEGKNYKV